MTVAELIIKLQALPQHYPVALFDSSVENCQPLDYISVQNLGWNPSNCRLEGADDSIMVMSDEVMPFVILHNRD